jgi:hypothetical protein
MPKTFSSLRIARFSIALAMTRLAPYQPTIERAASGAPLLAQVVIGEQRVRVLDVGHHELGPT